MNRIPVQRLKYADTERPVLSRKGAYTDSMQCCLAVGVQNRDKVFLYHVFPPHQHDPLAPYNTPEFVTRIINRGIGKLNGNGKPLQGIILGGLRDNPWSRKALTLVEDLLKQHGVEYSKFYGQHDDIGLGSALAYSVKRDTWLVRSEFPTSPSTLVDATTPDRLNRCFTDIRIADHDTVLVGPKRNPFTPR